MIKAEFNNEMQGVEISMKYHCISEIKIELLSILNACYENAPEVTLDVTEAFIDVLKESMEHDS